MSYDLERGLRDLGDEPHAHGDSGPALDAVLNRVHRGRALRTTTYSAAGVAAAAVIALGGIAGVQQLRAAPVPPATTPPAEPSPTTSPTGPAPTPTPSATADAPAWQPRWDWCGGVVNDDAFFSDVGGFTLWADDEGQVSADPSAPFTTHLTLRSEATQDQVVDARLVDISAATFTPEGFTWTIAGVEAAQLDVSTHGLLPAGGGLSLSADIQLTSCAASPLDGGDGSFTALPPDGYYDLLASVEVTTADGTTTTLFTHLGQWIGTAPDQPGAPTQPTTAGGYETALPEVVDWSAIPGCGEPYALGDTRVGVKVSADATTHWAEGAQILANLRMASTGLEVKEGVLSWPFLTVTRDGVVVAQSLRGSADGPFVLRDWGEGDAVQKAFSVTSLQCVPGDEHPQDAAALPDGVYEVWAVTSVQQAIDEYAAERTFVYGGPWPVVVNNR